jgi:hypothetical protein
MKKSHECELATHIGPESCGAARKGGVEAQPERPGPLGSYAAPDHSLAASGFCLSSLSSASHGRHHLRQEPDAGNPLVRIRGGGCE